MLSEFHGNQLSQQQKKKHYTAEDNWRCVRNVLNKWDTNLKRKIVARICRQIGLEIHSMFQSESWYSPKALSFYGTKNKLSRRCNISMSVVMFGVGPKVDVVVLCCRFERFHCENPHTTTYIHRLSSIHGNVRRTRPETVDQQTFLPTWFTFKELRPHLFVLLFASLALAYFPLEWGPQQFGSCCLVVVLLFWDFSPAASIRCRSGVTPQVVLQC